MIIFFGWHFACILINLVLWNQNDTCVFGCNILCNIILWHLRVIPIKFDVKFGLSLKTFSSYVSEKVYKHAWKQISIKNLPLICCPMWSGVKLSFLKWFRTKIFFLPDHFNFWVIPGDTRNLQKNCRIHSLKICSTQKTLWSWIYFTLCLRRSGECFYAIQIHAQILEIVIDDSASLPFHFLVLRHKPVVKAK